MTIAQINDTQLASSVVAVGAGTHVVKIGFMATDGTGGLTSTGARLLIVTTG
jgi:hypothetical protein